MIRPGDYFGRGIGYLPAFGYDVIEFLVIILHHSWARWFLARHGLQEVRKGWELGRIL
jgi:hypothetical protein